MREKCISICITVTFVICINFITKCQNQSILLPIPCATSFTGPDKILEFTNNSNAVISNLPSYQLMLPGGVQGNPHIDEDLSHALANAPDNIYSFNEKYLGQHPKFGQQVVHDKDGTILFFIVDNNIYNKHGNSFPLLDEQGNQMGGDMLTYVHDNLIISQTGAQFNRFGYPEPDMTKTLDPEIIVFPLFGECYKFGIIYSIFDHNGFVGAVQVYYKTITYINEDKIILSEGLPLSSNLFPGPEPCNNFANKGLAISDIRADNTRRFFLRLGNKLFVFQVDQNGIVDIGSNGINNLDAVNIGIDGLSNNATHNQSNSELEVIESEISTDNGPLACYFVAMGTCSRENITNPGPSEAMVNFIILDYQNCSKISQANIMLPDGNLDYEQIKGLEFSPGGNNIPGGNNLFIAYSGQNQLYYYNRFNGLSNLSIQGGGNASKYQYSEIETGKDGMIYYLFNDNNVGGISRISDPENPVLSVWQSNLNVFYSHDYDDNSRALLFADQVDGSDYTSYYYSITPDCCIDHLEYNTWPSLYGGDNLTWTPGIGNNPFNSVDGVIRIENDIEIPAGCTVSIKDFIIKFKTNKKLVVNKGAVLILDNTKLTSVDGCEKYVFWHGIEVWGTSNQHQSTIGGVCMQGTLKLLNGAIIENAEEGITNWKPNDFSAIGGIIQVDKSSFINNRRAVSFMPYSNFNPLNPSELRDDLSYFYSSNFITNKNLPNNEPF